MARTYRRLPVGHGNRRGNGRERLRPDLWRDLDLVLAFTRKNRSSYRQRINAIRKWKRILVHEQRQKDRQRLLREIRDYYQGISLIDTID